MKPVFEHLRYEGGTADQFCVFSGIQQLCRKAAEVSQLATIRLIEGRFGGLDRRRGLIVVGAIL
jgi:hypothetical protein